MNLEKSNNQFGIAFFLTIILAIACGILILVYGKQDSFILINSNYSNYADFFFKYFTYAGDGLMWAPLVIFCLLYRKKYVLAILLAILISTLLSQFLKRVVFPDELRPITYLSESFPIHLVEGVKIKRIHSFPSGHSTSTFTIALILAHMINKRFWSIILPVLAMLAAYSRVYLAQHFLTDVLAGMGLGIISALLSLMIFRSLLKTITKKSNLDSNATKES